MQLDPGVLPRTLPVKHRTGGMAFIFISRDFALESCFIWYSSVQTLSHHDAPLYFRPIQPTAVLGHVVKLKITKDSSGFLRRKSFRQRRSRMYMQIITHESDHFRLWVALLHQPLHLCAQSRFVRLAFTSMCRHPACGSQHIKRLRVP